VESRRRHYFPDELFGGAQWGLAAAADGRRDSMAVGLGGGVA